MRREKTGVFFPSCGQGHFLYWRASHRASTGASPIHDVRDRWINKRGEKIESEARSRRCAWIARSLSISLRAVNPRLLEDCARSLFPNLASRRESDRLSLSLFVDVRAKTPQSSSQSTRHTRTPPQDEPRETAARPLLVVLYFLVPHALLPFTPFFPHPL